MYFVSYTPGMVFRQFSPAKLRIYEINLKKWNKD